MQMGSYLTTFNPTSQQYGDFFAGYPWTLIGCGTFRRRVSVDEASSRMKRYMRDLGLSIKARVPYVAVPERRTSGCGLAPIPLHFHFLAACPSQWTTTFLSNAQNLWAGGSGNASIDLYDPLRSGAHYIAKLAGHQNFDYIFDHWDRLTYRGPEDLGAASLVNPYVPTHAKGSHRLSLVVREGNTKLPVEGRYQ